MESLNSNSQEKELHQLQQRQDKAKESCIISFRLLHSHLKALSNNDLKETRIEGCFERAFVALFDQDVQTFTGSMLINLDQLEQQLDKAEFQETGSIDAFRVLKTHNETESETHVSSSRSGNDTHAEDAIINSKNDKQPMAEVDRNTTPDSTDMSHRGRRDLTSMHLKNVKFNVLCLVPSFDK
ncbi:hypothetical protein Tco_1154399 [Tanacetum coccineum]